MFNWKIEGRVELLAKLWGEGHTCEVIANRIGHGLTASAIAGKVGRLNLPERRPRRRIEAEPGVLVVPGRPSPPRTIAGTNVAHLPLARKFRLIDEPEDTCGWQVEDGWCGRRCRGLWCDEHRGMVYLPHSNKKKAAKPTSYALQ